MKKIKMNLFCNSFILLSKGFSKVKKYDKVRLNMGKESDV